VDGWRGRCFEDFAVGEVYRHPFGRTISEADNTWFTLLTMNTNQMHFNAHYAAGSEFTRILVNSGLTIAMVLGMSVIDVSQHGIANLEMTEIKLTHPVFLGDTLYAESLVVDTRLSKSRPNAGIVTVRSRGLNQDGDVILEYKRSVLVARRGTTRDDDLFPEAKRPWTSPAAV
jgi:acyl dehydratase